MKKEILSTSVAYFYLISLAGVRLMGSEEYLIVAKMVISVASGETSFAVPFFFVVVENERIRLSY